MSNVTHIFLRDLNVISRALRYENDILRVSDAFSLTKHVRATSRQNTVNLLDVTVYRNVRGIKKSESKTREHEWMLRIAHSIFISMI